MYSLRGTAASFSFSRLWDERLDMDTPHGPLLRTTSFENASPGKPDIVVEYIDPRAVWTFLAQEVPVTWQLLTSLARDRGNAVRIILYEDGATTGNLLHNDPSKSMELFYFSFAEFSDSCLTRRTAKWAAAVCSPCSSASILILPHGI